MLVQNLLLLLLIATIAIITNARLSQNMNIAASYFMDTFVIFVFTITIVTIIFAKNLILKHIYIIIYKICYVCIFLFSIISSHNIEKIIKVKNKKDNFCIYL